MIKLSLLTIALFSAMSVQAAYVVKIPMEQNLGGSLPVNSIAFVGGIGGGSTTPATPDPKPEEQEAKPERKLVATLSFSPVVGETNIFTADQQNGFVLQTSTFVLKDALKHNQSYYITNNGNECKYNADVCTMNMNCVYSKSSLTGAYTILSISPNQAKACLNVVTNHFTGTKSLSNVTIYDNPKTE